MKFELKKIAPYLSFIILWILLGFIVNPIGEFPINDDWAYAHNVKSLVVDNQLYFSDWPAMTLFSQTIWGTLIGKAFGFSLTSLRIGTFVLSLLSALALFHFLVKVTNRKNLAWFATLVLCANPFFISLSFTFMTEIPYVLLIILGITAINKYFEKPSTRTYIGVILIALLAILLRQTALLLPIGFAIVWLLKKERTLKKIVYALLPLVIGFVSIELYKIFRISSGFSLGTYSSATDLFRSITDFNMKHYFERAGLIFMYVGLGLLPLFGLFVRMIGIHFSWIRSLRFVLILVLIIVCLQFAWNDFPVGNLLQDLGLGPKLLKDTVHQYNGSDSFYPNLWRVIKYLGCISFIFMAFAINCQLKWSIRKRLNEITPVQLLLGLLVIAEFGYLLINPIFFDRYTLLLTVLLLILAILHVKDLHFGKIGYGIVLLYLGVFSLLARDYMNWNRTKFVAFQYVTNDLNISANKIDAGFELNAWNQVAPIGEVNYDKWAKSWWFVDHDDYAICNGDYPGYLKVKGFKVGNILTPGSDSVFVLRRYSIVPDVKLNREVVIDFENFSDRGRQVLTSINESFMFVGTSLSSVNHSGTHSIEVNEDNPYVIGYIIGGVESNEEISVSIWVRGDRGKLIIETIEENPKKLKVVYPEKGMKNDWQKLELQVQIDESAAGNDLNLFYMNTNRQSVWVDDVLIQRKSDHPNR